MLQADTIAEAAERAGKKVVSVEWAGGSRTMTALKGPVVDYRNFYSNRGLWTNWDVPGQPAGATAFGVQYQRAGLTDASGWVNVPASYSPAKQGTFDVGSYTSGTPAVPVIANDQYDFYVFDATNDAKVNYDHVVVVPNASVKDGSKQVANLVSGAWADVKVTLANPAGKTGGFYVKAQQFAPDLSKFALYFTSVARAVATCNGCGYVGDFEEDLNRWFPSSTAADYAVFESGLVDADTYAEQGLAWKDAHYAYLRYILGKGPVAKVGGGTVNGMGYKADLLMLGNPTTDEFSHMFLGLTDPQGQRHREPVLQHLRVLRPGDHPGEGRQVHPRGLRGGRRDAGPRPQADGRHAHDVRRVGPRFRGRSGLPSTPARCSSMPACRTAAATT